MAAKTRRATGSESPPDLTTALISAPMIVPAKINIPPRLGVALFDLKARMCRFAVTPFGARTHLFCGEPTTDEKCSWCAEHRAVVFEKRTAQPFVRRRGVFA